MADSDDLISNSATSSNNVDKKDLVDEEDEYEEDLDPNNESSWWSLTTSIARSIKEQIPSQTKNAYFGIADAIHRSASAVVAEFAQMEIEAEREARRWRRERGYYSDDDEEETSKNGLPWEVSATDVDEELKAKIMALSADDLTFSGPFDNNIVVESGGVECASEATAEDSFELDSHVSVIRRLLQIDPNLADAHARLSGSKIRERVFWHNYFYHCLRTQIDHRSSNSPTKKLPQFPSNQSQGEDIAKITTIPSKEKKDTVVQKVTAPSPPLQKSNQTEKDDEDDDIVNIPSPPMSGRSIGDLVVVGATCFDLQNITTDNN